MTLAEVRLQEGESLENALRRFKRKVQTEDIIKEVRRHSYYLKPGEKRRLKQAMARKRARKKESKGIGRAVVAKQRPSVSPDDNPSMVVSKACSPDDLNS